LYVTTMDLEIGRALRTEMLALSPEIRSAQWAAWSPDGKEIAIEDNHGAGKRTLWIVHANGSQPVKLLDYQGSTYGGLDWSAAEFHPIAEMFWRVDAYDLLGDYAKLAGRREPHEATWRYYQLMARSKGDPGRLSFAERDELFDMEEAASRRQDFHAANRIHRFIKGSGPNSAPRRGSRRVSRADLMDFDDDDESLDMLSEMLAMGLEDTPPDMVKRMIEKLGQRKAVTALVDRIRASPLGAMPEPLLRALAESIVDSVNATNGRRKHE